MDRETYRRAFDSLPFSPDFQDRTEALLLEWVNRKEQEEAGDDHRRYSLHRCKRP